MDDLVERPYRPTETDLSHHLNSLKASGCLVVQAGDYLKIYAADGISFAGRGLNTLRDGAWEAIWGAELYVGIPIKNLHQPCL